MNHSGISSQRREFRMLDDYTLEELQRLGIDPTLMNKDQLALLQQRLGVTADGVFGPQTARALQKNLGVKVDGKWGKQSSGAYADAWTQARNDEQQYQSALAQGRTNPLVQDFTDFYNNELEQEKARQEKIEQLEQQIAQVKERIARNKRALSGKSYEDVNNQIAALEMKKINSQDPSMIWRWQQQRQDTKNANANVKSNEAAKFANTVDMWVNTRPAPTTEGIMQQISNINSAIRDGKNAGADVSKLVAKKEELENLIYGGDNTGSSTNYGVGTSPEQKTGELETVLATAKTSDELIAYKKAHPELKSDQLSKVDIKIAELKKNEDAKAKAAAKKKAVKDMGF